MGPATSAKCQTPAAVISDPKHRAASRTCGEQKLRVSKSEVIIITDPNEAAL